VTYMYSAVSWFISEYQRWGTEPILMVLIGASFLSVSKVLLTSSKTVRPVAATASEPVMAPARPAVRLPKQRSLRPEAMPPVLVTSHEQVEVEVTN
jgi:hypothetical protein